MDLILRNGKIMTPSGVVEGDLGIKAGKIAAMGKISETGTREIDCSGLHILPGAIDAHVHFRDPGFPEKGDFGTESAAAVAGGVTTILDMPNTNPPTLTLEALAGKRALASQKSHCHYGFYMGLSTDNLSEIQQAKNIAGVKVYMGSSTGDLLVQDENIIEKLFGLGKLVIVHAEEERLIREHEAPYRQQKSENLDPRIHSLIRDRNVAYEAVKSVLHVAKKNNARVHITHISTIEELEEIQKFKTPQVSCDATPHHLYMTVADYDGRGNFVKVNPPLRTEEDRQALWKGLKSGLVDCIASDHAPHTKAEKEQTYWNAPAGVPGVQTLLPLLLDSVNHGDLSLAEVVKLTAENPAKLFGIKNKGRLEVGFDADISVVNMLLQQEVREEMLFSKCRWSPFTGRKLQGWPVLTIVKGAVAYESGKVIDVHGEEVQFEIYE